MELDVRVDGSAARKHCSGSSRERIEVFNLIAVEASGHTPFF